MKRSGPACLAVELPPLPDKPAGVDEGTWTCPSSCRTASPAGQAGRGLCAMRGEFVLTPQTCRATLSPMGAEGRLSELGGSVPGSRYNTATITISAAVQTRRKTITVRAANDRA